VLTEPWKREKRQRRGVDGEVRAALAARLAEEVDAGVPKAPSLHRSTCGAPAKKAEGSAGPERHRRRAIAAAGRLTRGGVLGKIPARAGLELREDASESFQAARRSCCGPWPGLGCGGAMGPRRSRGAARRSKRPVVLGIRGGCSAAVGHKEGLREKLQGPNKEEACGLGVRAPMGIAVVIRAGEADRATARCDPGSGKETSGRRARTGDWPMGSCSVVGWSGATYSDGTAGRNRGSRRGEEEGKEGDGHRQVGSG
jgi:hypothetical protein